MDKKLEKLIATIMKECEQDNEPVTYDEAKEMAEIELRAKKECRRYEQSDKPRKKAEKVRKIDEEKGRLLTEVRTLLEGLGADVIATKTETEVEFMFNDNHYTIKLTKHRPPKK